MTKNELNYLAGAMDADGFLSMRMHKIRGCVTYSEFVGLGQVSATVPVLLCEAFGGTVRQRNRDPKWKTFFYWVATNKGAAICAKALLPYLKLKRRQAEIICALRQSKSLPSSQRRSVRIGIRSKGTNPEIVAHRVTLFQEIKALNRPGVIPSSS